MTTTKRWCPYGNWDDIASSSNEQVIKDKITGIVNYWEPNVIPPEIKSLIPEGSVIVDFGCGLGRNVRSLLEMSSTVIGYDIPEMIEQLNKTEEKSSYTRITSDLKEALEGAHVVYDSVVIQHIISKEELLYIAQCIQESSVDWVVSLNYKGVQWNEVFLSFLNWEVVLIQENRTTFMGTPHILRCLRRPQRRE